MRGENLRKYQFKPGHNAVAPLIRFWQKVEIQENGCWLWLACLARPQGYARLSVNGKAEYAHKFIYQILRGPIPPDKEIDHLCRNRACVNPNHMELVTTKENNQRGCQSRWTGFCKRGHHWNKDNTYIRRNGRSHVCRVCHRELERIAKRRRRGKGS